MEQMTNQYTQLMIVYNNYTPDHMCKNNKREREREREREKCSI